MSFLQEIGMRYLRESRAVFAPVDEDDGKKHAHPPFVRRCVGSITSKDGDTSRAKLSKAFAVCVAQHKKSGKAARDKRAVAKTSTATFDQRMKDYESALSDARKKKDGG